MKMEVTQWEVTQWGGHKWPQDVTTPIRHIISFEYIITPAQEQCGITTAPTKVQVLHRW